MRHQQQGEGMLILKRLAIWALESIFELVLFLLLLMLLSSSEQSGLAGNLGFAVFAALGVFMISSGYLLTTALFGVVFRSRRPWVYPVIATVLFIGHYQFLRGWRFPDTSLLDLQVGGACIVFFCTFLGNRILRQWNQEPGGPRKSFFSM
jgi:hypothetical protein